MSKLFIVMGQGVFGDMNHFSFCSGTFYTCSAIGMYNRHRGVGGLYHYPADSLRSDTRDNFEHSDNSLKEMIVSIMPTDVLIQSGPNDVCGVGGTSPIDIQALQTYFAGYGFPTIHHGEGAWVGFLVAGGGCQMLSQGTGYGNAWPDGRVVDMQAKKSGLHQINGRTVTLVGQSLERGQVNAFG